MTAHLVQWIAIVVGIAILIPLMRTWSEPSDDSAKSETSLEPRAPVSTLVPKVLLLTIGLVLLGAIAVALIGMLEAKRAERGPSVTTVWVPYPAAGGRMIPHRGVQVLTRSAGYVKFRTSDGRVIEHGGAYQIETENPD